MQDVIYIEQILQGANAASGILEASFAGLTATQIDWKPTPDRWSIGECLEHLIVVDSLYFPLFERITAGTYKMTLWQRISPLSPAIGRFILGSVEETPKSKVPAPKAFLPAKSIVGTAVLSRFREHQDALLAHIAAFAQVDLDATILSSPALSLMTYSLRDALQIIVNHQHRHLQQALRVRALPNFAA